MYGPCFSSIVGGHPLRSPTRRSLGGPLPHQLADGTQVPPKAHYCFSHRFLNPGTTCGISNPFGLLSHTLGQVTNALLTRSPLGYLSYCYKKHLVRLACIRHAASVHPEPGSNSPQKHPLRDERYGRINWLLTSLLSSYHFSVVKVLRHCLSSPSRRKRRCILSHIGSSDCNPSGLCL